jgi:GT2 family glycosyltransferase
VVDNASGDGSVEAIRKSCPEAELIASDANRGFAGGNNLALEPALAAGAENVLLLNNDAAIEERAVARLLGVLEAHPMVGIVGPLLRDDSGGEGRLSAGGRDLSRHLISRILVSAGATSDRRDPLRTVDYVPGTVVLIRADALLAVGLLDESYFFGGELADFCARARRRGYASAVDERTMATHRLDRSSELRATLHAYYILRNRFLYTRKFHARRKQWLYALWTLYGAGLVLANVARGRLPRARALALGLADGLRGRFGGQNERVRA